jgi:hypothetical protein
MILKHRVSKSRGKPTGENKMSKNRLSKTEAAHHISMFHGAEMALISPLIRSTDFNYDLVDECGNRGFIPHMLADALGVAKFLSRTILAAQFAQRSYGVPASFLISIGLDESAWDADRLARLVDGSVEWPGCECCYSPGIQRWFLETAKVLAESPKYRKARSLTSDVKAYAHKLCSLGFRSALDMQDILDLIESYGLEECDLAALKQPGEYSRDEFTAVRDEKGGVKLVNALLHQLAAMKRKAA